MAYKRPLTKAQSYILIILWIALCVYFIIATTFSLYTIFVIVVSAFFVWYPIIHSGAFRRKG